MLDTSPKIWTNPAYEISMLRVKWTRQVENEPQTWCWSIMPQAEQSGSAIFESKPVDLKEWETTLPVILLLLIWLITLTKCVSWNEPCNRNTREGEEAPQKKLGGKGEERWHFKDHSAQKIKVGRVVFQRGPRTFPSFQGMTKSLRDQNTDLFKVKHFTVFSTEGKSADLFAVCAPTPFL